MTAIDYFQFQSSKTLSRSSNVTLPIFLSTINDVYKSQTQKARYEEDVSSIYYLPKRVKYYELAQNCTKQNTLVSLDPPKTTTVVTSSFLSKRNEISSEKFMFENKNDLHSSRLFDTLSKHVQIKPILVPNVVHHNNLTSWQKYWVAAHSSQTGKISTQIENTVEPIVQFVTLRDISNNQSRKSSSNSNDLSHEKTENNLTNSTKCSSINSSSSNQIPADSIRSSNSQHLTPQLLDSTETMSKSTAKTSESFNVPSATSEIINLQQSQIETRSSLNTQHYTLPLPSIKLEPIKPSKTRVRSKASKKRQVISTATSTITIDNKLSQTIIPNHSKKIIKTYHTLVDNKFSRQQRDQPKQLSFENLSWISSYPLKKSVVDSKSNRNTKNDRSSTTTKLKHSMPVVHLTPNTKPKVKQTAKKLTISQHGKQDWTEPYIGRRRDPPAPCASPSASARSTPIMFTVEQGS
ncbi:unnamed protein product [Didymodactylos carnosus]|uniref:Uncharacterized protein n=1 Tax=Didymodactylos carnosus TaxID=1234261 RepID=A0A815BKI0_9BILA|nr:unnamed protein product [Didymodactylos carnosus]CAF1272810.1 unnamed protein product [Didymodactylos carnosus]CAF4026387.1 unnamed protein product [Didymodactylos carnosus]CAF4062288.1 unnamed protein product [Didymodactylos carnosus]